MPSARQFHVAFLQVIPGTECRAVGAQDNRADGLASLTDGGHMCFKLLPKRDVECVALIRPVE